MIGSIIINAKEINDFRIIEANAIARVEKNNNNKNAIFNIHLTAFYNKTHRYHYFLMSWWKVQFTKYLEKSI
jgi:hypothetical protein